MRTVRECTWTGLEIPVLYPRGNVLDLTWPDGLVYLGVPFKNEFVERYRLVSPGSRVRYCAEKLGSGLMQSVERFIRDGVAGIELEGFRFSDLAERLQESYDIDWDEKPDVDELESEFKRVVDSIDRLD